MSEEANFDRSNNDEKKKTRRTRKDEEGRDFTCSCGKSYLSYPALYTHIKTKHDGKPPKEGQSPPSKVLFQADNEQKDPLPSIQQSIKKYFDSHKEAVLEIKNENKKLAEDLISEWEGVKEDYLADASVKNPSATINLIFGRFLEEMKQKVNETGFSYLTQFICSFYQAIIEEKKDENFCRTNNGSELPNFFNGLIVNAKMPLLNSDKGTTYLQSMTLACKNLYFFGSWLFEQRFTNFSVKFNSNNGGAN